jgi:recombination protein RecT
MASTSLAQAVNAAANPAQTAEPKGAVGMLSSPVMLQQVKESLPAGLDAAAFVRHGITLVKQTPDLLTCDPTSVAQGIVRGAALGLDPDPALGLMWLVPRNVKKRINGREEWVKEATFQIGFKGWRELVLRSGRFSKIEIHEVRRNDDFDASFGRDGRLHHRPDWFGDRGPIVGWFAYALQHDGTEQFEVLSFQQAQEHAEKYAEKDRKTGEIKGLWAKDFNAAAQRTVFLRLAKWLPKSVEFERAISVDDTITRTPLGSTVRDVDVIRVDQIPVEAPAIAPVASAPEPAPEPVPDEAPVAEPELLADENGEPIEATAAPAETTLDIVTGPALAGKQRKLNARLGKLYDRSDDDSRRHALASIATDGRTTSSNELTASEWANVDDYLDGLEAGGVELHQRSSGEWELRRAGGAS